MRTSTMTPPTKIIQDIGFDANSSRRQNSGSSWPPRTSGEGRLRASLAINFRMGTGRTGHPGRALSPRGVRTSRSKPP